MRRSERSGACADAVGCGQIAEDHLCGALSRGALPDFVDVGGAGVDLAVLIVREPIVYEPLVQGQLPSVVGDQKHVVLVGGNHPVPHLLRTLRQAAYHLLLSLRGLQNHVVVVGFGDGQVQHIGGLNVRRLLEHGHELRQIVEAGEAGFGAVAGALRGQLNGGDGLSEGGGPGVKMSQLLLLQKAILQVLLHGIHFHHGVGDGCSGGKYNAPASGDLVQVAALHVQVAGLLGLRLGNAAHVPHF